jgi:hypothetical protein
MVCDCQWVSICHLRSLFPCCKREPDVGFPRVEELQARLDEEYAQLLEDYRIVHEFIFLWTPDSIPHYLPVNLQCIVQNAIQIFHIDQCDVDPVYIIATPNFYMHL